MAEIRPPALHRLTGPTDLLRSHWEAEPFVATGLGGFDDVFGLALVERLLQEGGLPLPSIRLFRDGAELPVAGVARRRERASAAREPLVDAAAVARELAAGATLVLEEVQTYWPTVADLCAEVTGETGFRTYSAAFLTPAGARGVAAHYDTASVLLRQVHGSKRWRIGRPRRRWPVAEWVPGRETDVEREPLLDVVLRAGECLYIPRGFTHVGTATDQASVHLSVGLKPVTWGMIVRQLLAEPLEEEPLRECLPYGFHRADPGALADQAAARAGRLAARLSQRVADHGVQVDAKRILDRLTGPARTAPAEGFLLAALTHTPEATT
ncbi:JmjC domain-containing protein [Streptacidiphilus rugosus]|uniref:JmjC domain-containing protein n=1 Tax=Streptacidiphilus rugosus TaxID=405783 RepID=UPI00068A8521|nr:cupin domain-containing protein [Streptacidiphilus rugosus]